jgi:hypothetical protein
MRMSQQRIQMLRGRQGVEDGSDAQISEIGTLAHLSQQARRPSQ